MITQGTEALGGGILGSNSRVEEQFDVRVIMCSEQRLREERHGMLAKVRGDVTDAQAAVRCRVYVEPGWRRRERCRVSTISILVLGENRLGRDVGAISERK